MASPVFLSKINGSIIINITSNEELLSGDHRTVFNRIGFSKNSDNTGYVIETDDPENIITRVADYLMEENFDVKFTLEEVTDVRTVEDIKRHLKSHGVNLDD